MTPEVAAKLISRIDTISHFTHAYAWHLNFCLGTATPNDLLSFAHRQSLKGVKIHVQDGESRSLLHAPTSRAEFARLARSFGLEVHIETSTTDAPTLCAAIEIALAMCATSVRCYPRYSGPVSQIIAQTIADLKRLPELDPMGWLDFLLELLIFTRK